jgi:hypothetical protein
MADKIDPKKWFDRLHKSAAQTFDIRIDADGRWYHEGDEIRRPALVKLFASVLMRDGDGGFWLVTPGEKGRIQVDDAPFIVSQMVIGTSGDNREAEITFRTNLDDAVVLGPDNPMVMQQVAGRGEAVPYIEIRDGLMAKLSRPVYYELAARAAVGPDGKVGVWSGSHFFAMED